MSTKDQDLKNMIDTLFTEYDHEKNGYLSEKELQHLVNDALEELEPHNPKVHPHPYAENKRVGCLQINQLGWC